MSILDSRTDRTGFRGAFDLPSLARSPRRDRVAVLRGDHDERVDPSLGLSGSLIRLCHQQVPLDGAPFWRPVVAFAVHDVFVLSARAVMPFDTLAVSLRILGDSNPFGQPGARWSASGSHPAGVTLRCLLATC